MFLEVMAPEAGVSYEPLPAAEPKWRTMFLQNFNYNKQDSYYLLFRS